MSKYKPGDKVIIVNPYEGEKHLKGSIFTLIRIWDEFDTDDPPWRVEESNVAWFESEFELSQSYYQQEEAKKLLGLK